MTAGIETLYLRKLMRQAMDAQKPNDDMLPLPSGWGFLTPDAKQAICAYARDYAEQRVAAELEPLRNLAVRFFGEDMSDLEIGSDNLEQFGRRVAELLRADQQEQSNG